MIVKTVNTYDIQINGQLLRIADQAELKVDIPPYKIKNLLLNEPRGNKYVNLITYNINCEEQILEVFLDTSNIIDNRDILLKSFIASLVDRGRINKKMMYQLRLDGEDILYKHDELQISSLFEAHNSGEFYTINDKKLKIEETVLNLEVNNLTEIKSSILEIYQADLDYLILYNSGIFAIVNKNGDIIPYPVIEVISLLYKKYKGEELTGLTGNNIEINNNSFLYKYYLIANSQFYIDDTDIYSEGFIIK